MRPSCQILRGIAALFYKFFISRGPPGIEPGTGRVSPTCFPTKGPNARLSGPSAFPDNSSKIYLRKACLKPDAKQGVDIRVKIIGRTLRPASRNAHVRRTIARPLAALPPVFSRIPTPHNKKPISINRFAEGEGFEPPRRCRLPR